MNPTPIILDHGGMHLNPAFSPDGAFLAVASHHPISDWEGTGGMILWNTNDWTVQHRFENDAFQGIVWHPSEHIVATAGRKRIALWDAASGKPSWRRLELNSVHVADGYQSLAFSPDGRTFAVNVSEGFPDAAVLLVDNATGETLRRLVKENDDREIWRVQFTPNGERVVALGYAYDYITRVYVWSVCDGALLTTFDLHGGMNPQDSPSRKASWLYLSRTGRYLATDHDVQIWEMQSQLDAQWHHRHTCNTRYGGAWQAKFSRDEQFLVTIEVESRLYQGKATTANRGRLWEVASGRELAAFTISGECTGLGISPDGFLLATTSIDGKNSFSSHPIEYVLTFWDLPSGRQLTHLTSVGRKSGWPCHRAEILVFSPDGQWLAVNLRDSVEVWDIEQIRASCG